MRIAKTFAENERAEEKRNDRKFDMEWLLEDEIRAGLSKGDRRSKERRWRI